MANYETVVEKDLPNKTLHVVREFKGRWNAFGPPGHKPNCLTNGGHRAHGKPLPKAWTLKLGAYGCIICKARKVSATIAELTLQKLSRVRALELQATFAMKTAI